MDSLLHVISTFWMWVLACMCAHMLVKLVLVIYIVTTSEEGGLTGNIFMSHVVR